MTDNTSGAKTSGVSPIKSTTESAISVFAVVGATQVSLSLDGQLPGPDPPKAA